MRRLSISLFVALAFFAIATPTYAANLPLLDPNFSIVPTECQACPCDYGGILQLVQNLMNAAVSLGVLAFVIVIAYSGFMFIVNPTNPEARSQAKNMLLNVAIGMVIVLAAWLLVDFIMKALYNENSYGPWNKILAPAKAGSWCITATDPHQIPGLLGTIAIGSLGGSSSSGQVQSGGTLLSGGTGACSATAVQNAAAQGGYAISASEANVLACLAKPESACGSNTSGARTSGGKATSASGPWQILLGASDKCHSLNIPACGNLNCSAAYSGGQVKSDSASQRLAAQCQAAANNLSCSAAAAACIVQASGGSYSAWTGTGDGYSHAAQKACTGG